MTRSRSFTAGIVICAVLGALDVLGLLGFGADDAPPAAVIIAGAVLGVITLAALRPAWRGNSRGVAAVAGSRVISALLGIPVFFVDDAPEWAPPVVAVSLVLTAVGVGLLYGMRRAEVGAQA